MGCRAASEDLIGSDFDKYVGILDNFKMDFCYCHFDRKKINKGCSSLWSFLYASVARLMLDPLMGTANTQFEKVWENQISDLSASIHNSNHIFTFWFMNSYLFLWRHFWWGYGRSALNDVIGGKTVQIVQYQLALDQSYCHDDVEIMADEARYYEGRTFCHAQLLIQQERNSRNGSLAGPAGDFWPFCTASMDQDDVKVHSSLIM